MKLSFHDAARGMTGNRHTLEARTRCNGALKVKLNVETGRIPGSEGKGAVTASFRAPAKDGSRNKPTPTFEIEGTPSIR